MPEHPGSWARRTAFGIDLTKPGVNQDHYVCAGYYSCTETGFADVVHPRLHVWVAQGYTYEKGVKSDRRAPAYEPILVTHIEATADGLGILVYGRAMLNWPRLEKYNGADLLPACMKENLRRTRRCTCIVTGRSSQVRTRKRALLAFASAGLPLRQSSPQDARIPFTANVQGM